MIEGIVIGIIAGVALFAVGYFAAWLSEQLRSETGAHRSSGRWEDHWHAFLEVGLAIWERVRTDAQEIWDALTYPIRFAIRLFR